MAPTDTTHDSSQYSTDADAVVRNLCGSYRTLRSLSDRLSSLQEPQPVADDARQALEVARDVIEEITGTRPCRLDSPGDVADGAAGQLADAPELAPEVEYHLRRYKTELATLARRLDRRYVDHDHSAVYQSVRELALTATGHAEIATLAAMSMQVKHEGE